MRKLAVLVLALTAHGCGDDSSSAVPINSGGGYSPRPTGEDAHFLRGPFASADRAMQIANAFRQQGYRRVIQYHSGDGYYVKVYQN